MQPYVLQRDGQAQAAAFRAGAGGVRLVEAVEDMWQDLGVDAGAAVGDLDQQPVRARLGGVQPHPDRLAAVVQGIADQVRDHDIQPPRVDSGPYVRRQFRRHPLLPGSGLQGLADGLADVHLVQMERRGSRVKPRHLHQVLHHPRELPGLLADQPDRGGGVGVEGVGVLVEHIGDRGHRRQRCPQLVRDIGREPPGVGLQAAQLGHALLQPGRHVVERPGQIRDLVGALDLQAGVQLALGDPSGGLPQAAYRPQHPARGEQRQDHGQHQHRQRAPLGGAHQRLDVGLLGAQRELGIDGQCGGAAVGLPYRHSDQQPGLAAAVHALEGRHMALLHRRLESGRYHDVAPQAAVAAVPYVAVLCAAVPCAAVMYGNVPFSGLSGALQLDAQGVQIRLRRRDRELGCQRVDLRPQVVDGDVLGALQDGVTGLLVGQESGGQCAEGGHHQEPHDEPGPQTPQQLGVPPRRRGRAGTRRPGRFTGVRIGSRSRARSGRTGGCAGRPLFSSAAA